MLDTKKLKGPVAPVLTIFKTDLSLDLNGLKKNVRHAVEMGMGKEAGMLLAVGAGGEFPSLSHEERMLVAETVVKEASGDVPVFVGVQHTNPLAAVELAKHAKEIGADGIQASPPYYYQPSEGDVFDFFKAINDSVKIPIMVYNTFWEGFNITPSFLGKLVELKNIICVKWSAPSIYLYKKGFDLSSDKVTFIDNSASPILSHMLGAKGFVSHEANFWPEHELELTSLLDEGSYTEARSMLDQLNTPFYEFRVKIGARKGGEAHVIKAAMDIVGLAGGTTRPPTPQLDKAEVEELRKILVRAGVPSTS